MKRRRVYIDPSKKVYKWPLTVVDAGTVPDYEKITPRQRRRWHEWDEDDPGFEDAVRVMEDNRE